MQINQAAKSFSLDISLVNKSSFFFFFSQQFLPGHQKLTERMRKRLYYGLDKDLTLDSLSGPVTGEVFFLYYTNPFQNYKASLICEIYMIRFETWIQVY